MTVPRDGKRPFVLTPTGYTLEIWGDGAWGAPVAYAGTNYLHTVAAQPSPVRLTWKWHGDDGMALIVR